MQADPLLRSVDIQLLHDNMSDDQSFAVRGGFLFTKVDPSSNAEIKQHSGLLTSKTHAINS